MALIICEECGNRVSDKASACPKCGCPVITIANEHNVHRQVKNVSSIKKRRKLSKKKKIAIGASVIICVATYMIVFPLIKFRKDLSWVVNGINPESSIDDVIDFEDRLFNNTVHNWEPVSSSNTTRYEFEPYYDDGDMKYHHYYFFDDDTGKLKSISFVNGDSHIPQIVQKLLDEYGKWQKTESDGLFNFMFGKINGYRCLIRFDDSHKTDRDCLFIDFEVPIYRNWSY